MNILKATQKLFEADKTLGKKMTPYSSEQLKGFRSETIKQFWDRYKSQIIDNGDGTIDVLHNFSCVNLKLESLEELGLKIRNVGVDFYCSGNSLKSLEGAPESVGLSFYCDNNSLTSLKGAPQSVGADFDCIGNALTSLAGAPKSVNRNFNCSDNFLTSLEGAPQSVGGNFACFKNPLTSLEGAPKSVGGSFYCGFNAKQFTEEEVRAVCKVKGEIYV